MWNYISRRILNAIPILIGVNIITFALFFFVNSPNDIAQIHLGGKYVTEAAKEDWKRVHGYHLPLFYNEKEQGSAQFSKTIFFQKSIKLLVFDFGISDTGRDIGQAIQERAWPSLQLAIPEFILGLMVNIGVALLFVFFRDSYIDRFGIFLSVVLISISALFFIIGGQYIIAKVLRWLPISGYMGGFGSLKFIALPVLVSIIAGLGAGTRWYRTLFLEEIHKDYVRTARAKGLSEIVILWNYVLKNALIPILTGVVAVLPLLFMGSLLLESFFGIPGLGSYTVDAIREQDFAIVRSMVFLGTVLYILGLLLTDIAYAWVDPRVRLQ